MTNVGMTLGEGIISRHYGITDERRDNNMEGDNIQNINSYRTPIEARYYQIEVAEALEMKVVDLFQDSDKEGHRLLSRADLILIYTLFKGGLEEFLESYKQYAIDMKQQRGYKVVNKPHYYLKNLIG